MSEDNNIKLSLPRRNEPICDAPRMCTARQLADGRPRGEACITIPRVFSEKRRYAPVTIADWDSIMTAGDYELAIPGATLYDFGVLSSNVHMAWSKAVCAKIKNCYCYSKESVYNNFPWPSPLGAQWAKIEQTAQAILDARGLYPDMSMADLYDERTMPEELRKAHQANDSAVMDAYGIRDDSSDTACLAMLVQRYRKHVSGIE